VGPDFQLALLEEVPEIGAGADELLDLVEEAVRAGVIVETGPGRCAFSHALVRQTLLEELSTTRRTRLHRRVGEALESLPDAPANLPRLAHHFAQAAFDGQVRKAVDYAILAAEEALDRFAFEQALVLAERGLEVLEVEGDATPGLAAELHRLCAVARWSLRDSKGARAAALLAVEHACRANDAVAVARCAILITASAQYLNPDEVTRPTVEDAIARLGDDHPGLRSRLLSGLARYVIQSEGGDALPLAEEAVRQARGTADGAVLSAALHAEFLALHGRGDPHRQLAIAEAMVSLADGTDRRRLADALHVRCLGRILVADVEGFLADLAHSEALAIDDGYLRQQTVASLLRAQFAVMDGRFAEAAELEAAIGAGLEDDHDLGLIWMASHLAREWYEGHYQEAVTMLDGMRHLIPGLQELATMARALIQGMDGDTDLALQAIEGHLAAGERSGLRQSQWYPALLMAASEVVGRAGSSPLAAPVYQAVLPYQGQLMLFPDTVMVYGAADRFLGMLATGMERWEVAERHFEDSLALEGAAGLGALSILTRYWHGLLLIRRTDRDDGDLGAAMIRAAVTDADAIGLGQLGAHRDQLLAELDARDQAR
jgi:hypothetical protein